MFLWPLVLLFFTINFISLQITDRKEMTTTNMKETSGEDLQTLLNSAPAVKADVNMLIQKLRRRQLTGSQQCARATLEVIRSLLGRQNFTSTDHMMKVTRAIGRELSAAAQTEQTIGNLVRRVLFFIREEHANQTKALLEERRTRSASKDTGKGGKSRRDRGASMASDGDIEEEAANAIRKIALEQSIAAASSSSSTNSNNNHNGLAASGILCEHIDEDDFSRHYPALKPAVLSAINEMSNEIDNYTSICQRAQDYIHVDECILTYGYSKIVELFLKAAAVKRRFQLIIVEAAPDMDGHKLAQILSKSSPSISITLIPDSNIYAMMARVNKVILSPQAIMADGGAIANSGHAMVAIAAKEFSVPVVCISGSFSLTPLYAHNQSLTLQQLLSPCAAISYDTHGVSFRNVEVFYPAFDHLTPDLISLYVTNDGSQLPSYVFRLLSEHYHPKDYIL